MRRAQRNKRHQSAPSAYSSPLPSAVGKRPAQQLPLGPHNWQQTRRRAIIQHKHMGPRAVRRKVTLQLRPPESHTGVLLQSLTTAPSNQLPLNASEKMMVQVLEFQPILWETWMQCWAPGVSLAYWASWARAAACCCGHSASQSLNGSQSGSLSFSLSLFPHPLAPFQTSSPLTAPNILPTGYTKPLLFKKKVRLENSAFPLGVSY